jgi:hypothetical protein
VAQLAHIRQRSRIDVREQVVAFPPQPVITSDNVVVSIDTVVYFQVIDAKAAVYEVASFIIAIEQLTAGGSGTRGALPPDRTPGHGRSGRGLPRWERPE